MTDNSNLSTTLKTYEEGVSKYIDRTRNEVIGEFKDFIDAALSKIEKSADILEIGTATGRDADYIEAQGYSVTRTDIIDGFIDYQRSQGKIIEKFDIINGNLNKQFNLILALAVFHHFNEEQLPKALQNTQAHLKLGGYFALSMKLGEGEKYTNEKMDSPRYYKYWTLKELEKTLLRNNFNIEQITTTTDEKWLQCLLKI